MKEPNLMLRLPRELRDEIYTHIFLPSPSPPAIICRQSGWAPSTDPFAEKSRTLSKVRYRLTNSTEAVEIRAAGPSGCQTWPSRDGSSSVISSMLSTSILRANKQIRDEALQSLHKLIFKNPILYAPPAGTRIAKSQSRSLILQQATNLNLIPFSWPQLQQCIPFLASNTRLKYLTINFKRMMKSVELDCYPTTRNIKTMLSQLSTIRSVGVEILWYVDLVDGRYLSPADERDLCRQAISITKALIMGGGTERERAWLGEYHALEGELTSWDLFCGRIDVSPGSAAGLTKEQNSV
jgi:hypothetical protein